MGAWSENNLPDTRSVWFMELPVIRKILQAFDADVYADLNYVQYNYTHDNPSGSFFECALGTSYQTYYRYNISVNDG